MRRNGFRNWRYASVSGIDASQKKYGVEAAIKDYPISLFAFDALFVDGKDLTQEPFPQRRKTLEKID